MEKLKLICLQYAAATQWLITSSLAIPKARTDFDTSLGKENFKDLKLRNPSRMLKLSTEEASDIESILYVTWKAKPIIWSYFFLVFQSSNVFPFRSSKKLTLIFP